MTTRVTMIAMKAFVVASLVLGFAFALHWADRIRRVARGLDQW